MPVESCRSDDKPGFRWGAGGKCFTYTAGSEGARNRAKQRAFKQGIAIEGGPDAARRVQEGKMFQDLAELARAAASGDRDDLIAVKAALHAAKFMDDPEPGDHFPMGITTFAELDAFRALIELAANVRGELLDGLAIVENITFAGETMPTSAINAAAAETAKRVRSAAGVTGEKSIMGRFVDRWRHPSVNLAESDHHESEPTAAQAGKLARKEMGGEPSSLMFTKDVSGRQRVTLLVSTNVRDREDEILTAQGQTLNVAAMKASGTYPEFWLSHVKGTRFGVADYAEVVDHVFVLSGLVDEGREEIGTALAMKADTLGVSHGYVILQRNPSDQRELTRWFTYEASLLPREKAALPLMRPLFEEFDMPPTDAEVKSVEEVLGKDLAGKLLAGVQAINTEAVRLGLDRKADDGAGDGSADGTNGDGTGGATDATRKPEEGSKPAAAPLPAEVAAAPLPAEVAAALETAVKNVVGAVLPGLIADAVKQATEGQQATLQLIAEGVAGMKTMSEALKTSDDDRLAEMIRSKASLEQASVSSGNAMTTEERQAAGEPGPAAEKDGSPAGNGFDVAERWMGAASGPKSTEQQPVTN